MKTQLGRLLDGIEVGSVVKRNDWDIHGVVTEVYGGDSPFVIVVWDYMGITGTGKYSGRSLEQIDNLRVISQEDDSLYIARCKKQTIAPKGCYYRVNSKADNRTKGFLLR